MKTIKIKFTLFLITFSYLHVSSQPIVNGQSANISDFPYQVSLDLAGSAEVGSHLCGGSILNEEWIVTAAHCVDGNTIPSDITVHAGSTNQTNNSIGQRIVVDQIIIHDNWGGLAHQGDDIALLHLSEALCFNVYVQPIEYATPSIPANVTAPGVMAQLTGWGITSSGGSVEENLRKLSLPIFTVPYQAFKSCELPVDDFPESMIAFYDGPSDYMTVSSGSAPGDSGGPATIIHNNEPLLIGISSWTCTLPEKLGAYPSVYTRVSSYSDFISNHMNASSCVVSCNFPPPPAIEINVNTLLDQPIGFKSDIIVNSGKTLTITSEVKMAPDKIIYVRPGATLIVDGGKITSCGADKWGGIRNQNHVELINGAIIENSICGVLNGNFYVSSTSLNCDNAHFLNNNYGIWIYNSYATMNVNWSSITGGEFGVYLLNSKIPPVINNSSFSYLSNSGIISLNSEIDIQNGNHFVGCDKGIAYATVYGYNTQSRIGTLNGSSNTFLNNNKGIYSINGDLDIRNNMIDNNSFGLYYSGQNIFNSVNNTFDGASYAEGLYSTGTNSSESRDNIYNSDVGIFPWLLNSGYTFIDNCFSTLWWDVNVPSGSEVSQAQGELNYAASNCFTKGGVPDFICASANTVIYNVPSDPIAPQCLTPTNPGSGSPSGNFELLTVGDYDNDGCGGASLSSHYQYQYILDAGCELEGIINNLKWLIEYYKNKPLNDHIKWLLNYYERNLVFAMQQLAWCLRTEGKFVELKNLYNEWAIFIPEQSYPKIKSAEVSYNLGDSIQAKSELSAIALEMPYKQNVIDAIKLSIDVMTFINSQTVSSASDPFVELVNPAYVLTTDQYNLLVSVAQSSDPDAAYGRALLGYLTGEYLEPNIPFPTNQRFSTSEITEVKEVVNFYPNPTKDNLALTIDNVDDTANYLFSLYDIHGLKVLNGQLENVNLINLQNLTNGLYILKITKNGILLETKKIIIQK